MKKTVLLDLDGVLNTYRGDYVHDYIPPLREGAKEFVQNLAERYNVKLFTTRRKKLVECWINDNNLEKFITDVTDKKEIAWIYVDDRCIRFDGEYERLISDIDNFKAWYRAV